MRYNIFTKISIINCHLRRTILPVVFWCHRVRQRCGQWSVGLRRFRGHSHPENEENIQVLTTYYWYKRFPIYASTKHNILKFINQTHVHTAQQMPPFGYEITTKQETQTFSARKHRSILPCSIIYNLYYSNILILGSFPMTNYTWFEVLIPFFYCYALLETS